MAKYTGNDTTTGNIQTGALDQPIYTPTQKLDADDYSAEDINAAAEGASGSGNMNYLMLQAQQTHETQLIDDTQFEGSDVSVGNSGISTVFSPDNATTISTDNPLSEANETATNFDASAESTTDGVQAGDHQNSATSSLGSLTGSAAEQSANVGRSLNAGDTSLLGITGEESNSSEDTNNNNNDDGGGNPPPPGGGGDTTHEPLLVVDSDIDLGDTLENVIDTVTDAVNDTLGTITNLAETPPSQLAGAIVDQVGETVGTVNQLADGAQETLLNTTKSVSGLLDNGISLTDPVDNLEGITQLTSEILGGNTLNLGIDLRGITELDAGISLEGTLPTVSVSLTPELLGSETIELTTADILEQPVITDTLATIDSVTETPVINESASVVEETINDTAAQLSEPVEAVGETLVDAVDTLQDTVSEPLGSVTETLSTTADSAEELLSPVDEVADTLEQTVTEPLTEDVSNLSNTLDDFADPLLGSSDTSDSDLATDANVADASLGTTEEITLDPVEEVVGDIDINLLADADSGGTSDGDITVDASNELIDSASNSLGSLADSELLSPSSGEELISDLSSDTTATDLISDTTTTDGAIGDLLPSDTTGTDSGDIGGTLLSDALPEPSGSVDDGLSGLTDDQSGFGGLGGLL